MRHSRIIITALLGGILVLPALAEAQSRGRAVPRGSVRVARPPVIVSPRHFYRSYRPPVSLGFYYGSPWYGGLYAYRYGYPFGYYGYGYPGYGYPGYGYPGYGYPYGYLGGPGYAVRSYGGVRIDLPQKDAEVYVDGYYAGVVNDFDGSLQQVNLEPGPHKIEVRAEGYQPVSFEVNVEPGRTIRYRAALRQARP
jgi:hypothetical protein